MPRKINKRKKIQAAKRAEQRKAEAPKKHRHIGMIGHVDASKMSLTAAALLLMAMKEKKGV